MPHKKRSINEYRQVKDSHYIPPTSHKNMKKDEIETKSFHWNDERVKLFCKLYSTNFNGLDEEIFSYILSLSGYFFDHSRRFVTILWRQKMFFIPP